MESTSWLKQVKEPLFPDVLWSRPENRRLAGKLLIIGGHKQNFNAVSEAYTAALKAGIGTARVLLPESLHNMLKAVFPEAEYAPSNKIGSFGRDALAVWLEAAEWADGVLLAGDFGRNSETAILLEGFLEKYEGLLSIVGDTIDYYLKDSSKLKRSSNYVITAALEKVQKIAVPEVALKHQDDLALTVKNLSLLTERSGSDFVISHSGNIIVASGGRVSTTPTNMYSEVSAAAFSSVWRLQQISKPFEALTTAAYCYTDE